MTSRPARIASTAAFVAFCGISGIAMGSAAAPRSSPPAPQTRAADIVGRPLPDLPLMDLAGERTRLHPILSAKPSLVYVVDRKTCLDCTQIPMEIRVLRRTHPHLQHVLVAAGSDTAFYRRYAVRERITHITYLDPDNVLSRAVATDAALPLIFLVDDSARVLMVDARGGPAYSPFGTSRLLPAIQALLAPPGDAPASD